MATQKLSDISSLSDTELWLLLGKKFGEFSRVYTKSITVESFGLGRSQVSSKRKWNISRAETLRQELDEICDELAEASLRLTGKLQRSEEKWEGAIKGLIGSGYRRVDQYDVEITDALFVVGRVEVSIKMGYASCQVFVPFYGNGEGYFDVRSRDMEVVVIDRKK